MHTGIQALLPPLPTNLPPPPQILFPFAFRDLPHSGPDLFPPGTADRGEISFTPYLGIRISLIFLPQQQIISGCVFTH